MPEVNPSGKSSPTMLANAISNSLRTENTEIPSSISDVLCLCWSDGSALLHERKNRFHMLDRPLLVAHSPVV